MESCSMIVNSLEEIPPFDGPIALTIGMFDGVHLGHQHLLQELKKRGKAAVLTFSHHPADTLRPGTAPPLLCTLEKKLNLLQKHGADLIIALPFTSSLATLSYDTFLKQIRRHLPFTTLVRGQGDAFGHNQEGTEENVRRLAQELNFEAVYLPKFMYDGEAVSSKKIRTLIEQGDFQKAFHLLKGAPW
jgi:riboflavin kinase / FMN adenylyltransferase